MKIELTVVDQRVSLGRRVLRMFGLAFIVLWLAYYAYNAGAQDMLNYMNSWPKIEQHHT